MSEPFDVKNRAGHADTSDVNPGAIGAAEDRPAITRVMVGWILVAAIILTISIFLGHGARIALLLVLAGASTVVLIYQVTTRPLYARAAWATVTAGAGLWFVSTLLLTRHDLPPESLDKFDLGHAARLVAYGLLILGAWLLVRTRHTQRDTTTVTDSLIVLAAGAALLAWTTLEPAMASSYLSRLSLSLLAAYATLDLLLLSVVVRLWFASSQSTNRGIRLMSVAFLALLVADLGTQWVTARQVTVGGSPGSWVDLLFGAFFAIAALAALDPDTCRRPTGDRDPTDVHRGRILALLLIALLVPPLALLLFDREWAGSQLYLLLGLTGLLAILISLRISLLLYDYRNLVARSETLAKAADAIAAADSPAQVDAILPSWVAALAAGSPAAPLTAEVTPDARTPTKPNEAAFGIAGTDKQLQVSARRPIDAGLESALSTLAGTAASAYDRIALRRHVVEESSQRRVESLLQQSLDVVLLVSRDGVIDYATPAITAFNGLTPAEAPGMAWHVIFHDRDAADSLLARARGAGEQGADGSLTTADDVGEFKYFDVKARWLADEDRYVVTAHDVTERQQMQEALRRQAFHDPLTGLANRVLFRNELVGALMRARRSPFDFVVMMIDLDDFKQVNDSLGHPAGDALLCSVAERLRDCLREGDLAARLGGDEFAIVLENTTSVSDAEAVAARILDRLSQPVMLGSTEVVVGASIGVAVGNAASEDADELARNADLALYRAKYGGKNRFHVYEPSMHADAVERLELTTELRHAIEADDIAVVYQGIVDLRSGAVVGVEALARWKHPTRGLLLPSEFIPLAESSGLINRIGESVMMRAMGDMVSWHERFPQHVQAPITVNISARQLVRDDFVAEVQACLQATGLAPASVILDVTEATLLPGEQLTRQRLAELAELGLRIYIDDWGTGWSSLRYLDSLPVSGLKLAAEFVADLPQSRQMGLARAVLDLATSLQLEGVIAEGIERGDQVQTLTELGYQLGQGYFFGRPVDAASTATMLAANAGAPWPAPTIARP